MKLEIEFMLFGFVLNFLFKFTPSNYKTSKYGKFDNIFDTQLILGYILDRGSKALILSLDSGYRFWHKCPLTLTIQVAEYEHGYESYWDTKKEFNLPVYDESKYKGDDYDC